MNLRQTAEVATIVATSASHVVENPRPIPVESLHGYWKQSRTRLKCWFAGLQTLRLHQSTCDESAIHPQQGQLIVLCREILATEMLTRVWSTVLIAADRIRGTQEATAAVDAVMRGHLEARNAVLELLTDEGSLPLSEQISLDRFRRRVERWTDALIGPLLNAYGVGLFAFDIRRAEEFAESALQDVLQTASDAYRPLLLAGVATAFTDTNDADRERATLNMAIIRSILAAFPAESFGNDGQLKTPRVASVERSSRHAEGPVIPDEETGNSRQAGRTNLNFIDLRRRDRRSEDFTD